MYKKTFKITTIILIMAAILATPFFALDVPKGTVKIVIKSPLGTTIFGNDGDEGELLRVPYAAGAMRFPEASYVTFKFEEFAM